MQIKKLFRVVLLLFGVLFLMGCNDEENKEGDDLLPFHMEKIYYEVKLKGFNDKLCVTNGSLDISLSVADPAIIGATYSKEVDASTGYIRVEGKQKGSTVLTVKDNVTKEWANLVIKVTDTYVACAIDESNHSLLTTEVTLFLVNNEARDFYLFTRNHMTHALNNRPSYYGNYAFSVEKNTDNVLIPFLTLNYTSEEKGKSADTNTLPMTQRFDIRGSSQLTYQYLERVLGVNWNSQIEGSTTKGDLVLSCDLVLKEVGTKLSVQGKLTIYPLPDNVLK